MDRLNAASTSAFPRGTCNHRAATGTGLASAKKRDPGGMSRFLPYSPSHPNDTSAREELLWATVVGYFFFAFYVGMALLALAMHWMLETPFFLSFVTVVLAVVIPHSVHTYFSGAHECADNFVPGSRTHRFAACLSNYFPVEFVLEDDTVDLDPHFRPGVDLEDGDCSQPPPQFVFGMHPHGIHSVPALLFGYNHSPLANRFPRVMQRVIQATSSVRQVLSVVCSNGILSHTPC